jgi:hypothetical protein
VCSFAFCSSRKRGGVEGVEDAEGGKGGKELLAAYKRVADVLLPAMRGRNHLYHTTYAKDTTTIVVLHPEETHQQQQQQQQQQRPLRAAGAAGAARKGAGAGEAVVVGGITFRVVRAGGGAIVIDVLTLYVNRLFRGANRLFRIRQSLCRRAYTVRCCGSHCFNVL